jgi:hypothetical protein
VDDLEAKVAAIADQLKAVKKDAIDRAADNTRRGLEDLQHNLMQYVDRLRTAVAETAGGSWQAFIGPVLIVIGFLMQIASNIMQIAKA